MASGHINPSLGVARALVEQGSPELLRLSLPPSYYLRMQGLGLRV